ncbi:hypothetical protein EYW49_18280 [Siculibacillus lacustris]|uniref:Uncharacterized protein n=1 Tax=Siculibacillus lacustris TaxID=1549641 RepID=A0A4Q9VJ32_9HYPH|nr:hypothetical protein [Siculibacillus lacustris]TBW34387.1 hypothetical protein EYW49_18280 [Siculibacillus lacustris]
MSMMRYLAAIACVTAGLVLAAVVTAPAQTVGHNQPSTSPPTPTGASGGGSSVLLYGSPGNCPPTIACGPSETRLPPHRVKPVKRVKCDRWVVENGVRVRDCRVRQPLD